MFRLEHNIVRAVVLLAACQQCCLARPTSLGLLSGRELTRRVLRSVGDHDNIDTVVSSSSSSTSTSSSLDNYVDLESARQMTSADRQQTGVERHEHGTGIMESAIGLHDRTEGRQSDVIAEENRATVEEEDTESVTVAAVPLVRKRRSSVWLIHTMLSVCESHRRRCKQVEVDDGNVRMRIDLQDQ